MGVRPGKGRDTPARVRGEDGVCKRLPQHGENKYTKSAARGEARAESFWAWVGWGVGGGVLPRTGVCAP